MGVLLSFVLCDFVIDLVIILFVVWKSFIIVSRLLLIVICVLDNM